MALIATLVTSQKSLCLMRFDCGYFVFLILLSPSNNFSALKKCLLNKTNKKLKIKKRNLLNLLDYFFSKVSPITALPNSTSSVLFE